MPAQATTPRWANRHALRAQGGAAAAATSTPRSMSRLLGLGIVCMFGLCLQGFSQSAWVASAVAQSGTVLIDERFTGASVLDPGFTVHGSTCLTGAPDAPMPPVGKAQIPDCSQHRSGPVPPLGGTDGYLQLTDTQNNQAGDILYDRPLPAIAGIVVEFDQWQYGGNGADGISFFLVDGGTKLEKTGGIGGSLGYAQHNALPGILGGVLGLGLDAFGNYYNDLENRGTGCATQNHPFPAAFVPNAITLRGPGALTTGYCYLASTTEGTGNNNSPIRSTLALALRSDKSVLAQVVPRRVRITVQPAILDNVGVKVEVDFNANPDLNTVFTTAVPREVLPVTYKFGFAGSTGSQNDVHLLRNLAVSTVNPLAQLTLVKQIDRSTPLPNPLVAGSRVPYQFVVTNAGSVQITELKINDPKIGVVNCPTTTLQPAPHTDSRVVCTGSYELTSADVRAVEFVNTATATGIAESRTITSNESTVHLPLPPLRPPQADLMVTKTNLVSMVTPGTLTTYVLAVTNLGPDAVQGATVRDPLPPGIRAFEWSCAASGPGSACPTPSSGTGELNTTVDLAVNGSVSFVVRAQVDETAVGSITDTVTVTTPAGVTDPTSTNNMASDTDTVVPQADIAVLKEVDIRVPAVGDTVTFTVTVTNNGPSAASGVTIIDRVPTGAGLTLIRATPSGDTTYNPENGDWVIGALAVGASATLTLAAQVEQVEQAGVIRNEATKIRGDQNDPDPSNDRSGVDLTNQPVADIQVRKTADRAVLPVGSDVTFTVTVRNAGPNAASGVEITDVLPTGLALLTATPSQGAYDATTGVWTIGALAVGSSVTLTLRATVQEAGRLTNGAAKTAQVERDPVPGNDVAGVTINGQAADVQVVKTVDRAMPNVGETVTFTVTVSNNGPNAASGVQVLDTLSERLTFVSATPSQGTYDATTGVWRVGTLASAGADATARLQVTATVAQAGPLTNLAVKINQDQPDPNPANDQDSIAPPGQPVADLVVTKSDGLTSVVSGTEVVYTVVVTNRGPSAVTGATVSDPMPLIIHDPTQMLRSFEGLTWTCVASAGSACPAGGTEDLLAVVDLLVGGTATFTIRGRAASVDRGTLVNTVKVTAPPEVMDPLPGNNSATDTDLLTQVADLSITKTDEVESVVPGMIIRYTLVVRNAGPSAVIGALVEDPASVALQGVRWTCVASSGSSCLAEGIGPIATTVNLEPGGTVTFTLTGTVAAEAMGTLANTAMVTAPPAVTDPEPGNNTVTNTNAVTPPRHAPSGRKTVSAVALPDLEWRVVWLNPANAEPPLRIRGLDPIPTATTYVDGSVTCVARGVSTVERCDFDAATNELIYDGIIGPDPGATTEEQAANAVVITFRTTVLPGVTQVANQALAHWDENGNGVVDDDIRAGQVPVQTGIEFRQSDPTVATLPPLACLFQQRLLALTGPAGGGPTDTAPTDGQDPGADAGVDRQSAPGSGGVFTLSTPLDSDTVAGTTVALAALQVPVSGTVVSQPAVILIANGVSADTLDLVENVGRKTERVPAGAAHDVVTADGVVGEISATALAAADTLRLERVAPTTAPAPLPGIAVSPLVALTLASGRTTFSSPVTLSLPYPDENQDGLVDEMSPALPELTLTAWIFDAASQRWLPLPEARVFTAFNEIRVTTTQTGLYGVFQATDGRTGLAGTSVPAVPGPRSATAQGLGWQDIGVVTTFPFLVPLNTTTLPNGTYALRAICATNAADLSAAAGNSPAAASVLRTSGGSGGGGGGCSLGPEGGWSRATALDTAGNLGVPLVVLLVLGLWVWRRPR